MTIHRPPFTIRFLKLFLAPSTPRFSRGRQSTDWSEGKAPLPQGFRDLGQDTDCIAHTLMEQNDPAVCDLGERFLCEDARPWVCIVSGVIRPENRDESKGPGDSKHSVIVVDPGGRKYSRWGLNSPQPSHSEISRYAIYR
jgi:hypothetical protein